MKLEEFNKLREYRQKELLFYLDIIYWVKRVAGIAFLITVLSMSGCPTYNVWKQGLTGKAELARAQQNRQITIEEALALKESATYKKEAEIIRAEGVKGANAIIADGLGGPEGYLRYLYIDALDSGKCQTIYVPTEAGLPIMEATRGRRSALE